MKTYEAMLLLDNREVKNGWDPLKEKVDGILTKHGAKILVAKRWDERKLAYEIKKQKRATYYLAYLEADPESIDPLSRSLKLSGPVLRHLVLRCEEIPEEAYEPEKEFDLEESDSDSSEEATEEGSEKTEAKEGEEASADEGDGDGDAEADAESSDEKAGAGAEGEGAEKPDSDEGAGDDDDSETKQG